MQKPKQLFFSLIFIIYSFINISASEQFETQDTDEKHSLNNLSEMVEAIRLNDIEDSDKEFSFTDTSKIVETIKLQYQDAYEYFELKEFPDSGFMQIKNLYRYLRNTNSYFYEKSNNYNIEERLILFFDYLFNKDYHNYNDEKPRDNNSCLSIRNEFHLSSQNSCMIPDRRPLYLIPQNILNMTSLRTLDLSITCILLIPPQIKQLINLESLRFENSYIKVIPAEIGFLTQLISLDLSKNKISYIADEIFQLPKIQHINLDNNSLVEFPEKIGKLTTLKALTFNNNFIIELPQSISNLTSLQILRFEKNIIRSIPESFDNLNDNILIYVYGNPITKLSPKIKKIIMVNPANNADQYINQSILILNKAAATNSFCNIM